jgi:hypothetical protein
MPLNNGRNRHTELYHSGIVGSSCKPKDLFGAGDLDTISFDQWKPMANPAIASEIIDRESCVNKEEV